MIKVTLTVETDDQVVQVTRYGETHRDVAQALGECAWRVADTYHAEVLEDIARAVRDAIRARRRPTPEATP